MIKEVEDKAILRLNNRINGASNNDTTLLPGTDNIIKKPIKVELPKNEIVDNRNSNNEPSDWSNELTAIDLEIKRLKWSREDEINFLEKSLGYNNRNKITNYNDILKYLSLLKNTDNKNQSTKYNLNINYLITESDNILSDLSWNHVQGREFLLKEFNVSTRKELNEKQLLSFVEKLKSIRNQYLVD